MEKQIKDRQIIVCSGLMGAGKTQLLMQLYPDYAKGNTRLVRMDEVQEKYWGEFRKGQLLTHTERIYRNELTRNEIKNALIIDGAETVFVELPMLTRRNHQRPFVEMVRNTQSYLQAIERERSGNMEITGPEINLKVLLLYCSPETIRRRLAERQGETGINPDALDMEDFLIAARQFEFPDKTTYLPFPINTSDPTINVLEEANDFLMQGHRTTPRARSTHRQRMSEARGYLSEVLR